MLSTQKGKDGVSVVICCYNSASRLPATLRYLAYQKLPSLMQMEIVVVDNNSNDNTSEVARSEWDKYNTTVPLRVVHQIIPGTGPARELGISSAEFELILFCDDDNWMSQNYIEIGYNIMRDNTRVCALGGHGHPEFEREAPAWFQRVSGAYGLGAQGDPPFGEIFHNRNFIYTAGGFFRKSLIVSLMEQGFKSKLIGRTSKDMTPGEDVELCHAIILNGNKIYYNQDLQFKHFMPNSRLTIQNCRKMFRGFGTSYSLLMPYKILLAKQKKKFNYGINWLFISAFYLVAKSIFVTLPLAALKGDSFQARLDFESNLGFLLGLKNNYFKIRGIYKDLSRASWISNEYKALA